MACMEHDCRECDNTWFDNHPRGVCAVCGSTDVAHYFDEEGDHDEEE